MPASGKKEVMSQSELQQRQEAPRKHGAYAFRDRGEEALDKPQRSRLQELKDQVRDYEGVLELMQERAANAVMMCELLTSHIAKELKLGVSLTEIPSVRSLPAFMNTAQRALKDLVSVMPNERDTLDTLKVLEAVKDGRKD